MSVHSRNIENIEQLVRTYLDTPEIDALLSRVRGRPATHANVAVTAQRIDSDIISHVSDTFLSPLAQMVPAERIPSHSFHRVVRKWLHALLAEAAFRRSVRLSTLKGTFSKVLVDEFKRPDVVMRSVVPLVNLQCPRQFTIPGTWKGRAYKCVILKRDGRHPSKYGAGLSCCTREEMFASVLDYRFFATKCVLIVDVRLPKDHGGYIQGNSIEQQEIRSHFVRALRLFQDGAVSAPFDFHSRDTLTGVGEIGLAGSNDMSWVFPQTEYNLEHIVKFRQFWKWYEKTMAVDLPPRLRIAVEFFELSYVTRGHTSFLNLCIALESLFGTSTEITYRLPLRVAALLAKNKTEACKYFDSIREIWTLRNKVAHGDPEMIVAKCRKQIEQQLPVIREFVRKGIIGHARLNSDNPGHYETMLKDFEKTKILHRVFQSH
ncbi:MAG: hypothetical protein HOP29_02755 [Phycisphaerales bacterium]|nr:hypothetical protein [Phycisphaerales bacterium]